VDLGLDDHELILGLGDQRLGRRLCLVEAEGVLPFGIGTPNFFRISFAWYSWIFTAPPDFLRLRSAERGLQRLI